MKRKNRFINAAAVLAIVAGICIILYPSFSDWMNSRRQSRAVSDYISTVKDNGRKRNEKMWNDAVKYNKELADGRLTYDSDTDASEKKDKGGKKNKYSDILDVTGTGIMGYIKIPKIKMELPIYHGTSKSVLQIAAGHVKGTSLPVGGNSSRCVITGHTGLPSARLFTDIDKLDKGDTFEIAVLDHRLTYEVCDIRKVLPENVKSIRIQKGKDLVTLVTCTPYGINTHRLLVTGRRIKTPENAVSDKSAGVKVKNDDFRFMLLIVIAILSVAAAAVLSILIRRKKRKKAADPGRGIIEDENNDAVQTENIRCKEKDIEKRKEEKRKNRK